MVSTDKEAVKPEKDKRKQTKVCVGRETHERMNFLYQAAVLMSQASPQLSASYGKLAKSIGKKAVLRMEPAIKRTLCVRCGVLLNPATTADIDDYRHKQLCYLQVNFDKSHLLELESLFGQALLSRAIDIVYGKQPITAYCNSDGQCSFLDVPGSKYGTVYKVFPGINFCACESFRDWVLKQKRQPTCKHVLAARLALILRRKKDEPIATNSCLGLKQQFVADCMK